MSESSPEVKQAAQDAQPAEKKQVPVEAVAKERAEKRAARAEADALKEELSKVKQSQEIDVDALAKSLDEITTARVESAVQLALKPFKDEADKWKSAAALGLNEAQADVLQAIKTQWPGMPDDRALALARIEKPDLFPVQQQARTFPNGLPVTGDSLSRSSPDKEDYRAQMHAAKDPALKQQLAEKAFYQIINNARKRAL